ncbi:hypothetical protein SDRG_05835 [Saprolegnia diclina VS20]|uniref:Uncharacterized protein n=1 Tax=Saprolegnia diclina (strain VS20) TaxID=1156394 RepID=T0RWW4_SAPDV|nr:hypothetical protein SDRG_05835 [Saprolegnia diclina VS20]EQC37018.1 hypothetical protein SDRG_05835 [Saprolegnia diclina VS20]|eukprot:XP_008609799.1 hypothetical protein SDRG_05835 [Saprolegnia diclina VS20]
MFDRVKAEDKCQTTTFLQGGVSRLVRNWLGPRPSNACGYECFRQRGSAITVLTGNASIQASLVSLFGAANAAYYNGVPKPERARTLARANVVHEAIDADVREYVLYATETRLGSSRWHIVADAFVSTYSAATRLCVERNVGRKRGDRISVRRWCSPRCR